MSNKYDQKLGDKQQQISDINEKSSRSWTEIANELLSEGFITEFHPVIKIFSKHVFRNNQDLIFSKLEENGYGGEKLVYIEVNLNGPNGWAIYNPGIIDDKDVKRSLIRQVEAL